MNQFVICRVSMDLYYTHSTTMDVRCLILSTCYMRIDIRENVRLMRVRHKKKLYIPGAGTLKPILTLLTHVS